MYKKTLLRSIIPIETVPKITTKHHAGNALQPEPSKMINFQMFCFLHNSPVITIGPCNVSRYS